MTVFIWEDIKVNKSIRWMEALLLLTREFGKWVATDGRRDVCDVLQLAPTEECIAASNFLCITSYQTSQEHAAQIPQPA